MKKLYFIAELMLLLFLVAVTVEAQNVTVPRAVSPAAQLTQTIGLSTVTVNYSRPRVTLNGNDRTGQIWGQQVPYELTKIAFAGQGEIPWRAGANENTTIEFSDDVNIEGEKLSAGIYGLHMIIHENGEVTVIFSNNSTSWGSFWYKDSEDALRTKVKSQETPHTEVLTYSFVEMGTDYGVLALSWESKRIPFRIQFDINTVVLANIRNELRSLPGFSWQGFNSAANFCVTNNINLEEGLQWVETSIGINKNFNNMSTKVGILFNLNKPNEEIFALADEASQLANMNQLNGLGYQMMGRKFNEKAVEYFKLNVKNNPEIANVHDSLGEGFIALGKNTEAAKSLRKSLSLNPPANVKANSIKLLKQIGEEVDENGS